MNKTLKLFDKVAADAAYLLLLEERLKDLKETARRYDVCKANAGGCYNEHRDKCTVCGCYMSAKTRMLKHIEIKKGGRVEITRCPLSKWGEDVKVDGVNPEHAINNYYKQLDQTG